MDIPVPRRRGRDREDVEVNLLVLARDMKEGVVFPLVRSNPDAIAYVKLGPQYLNARRFGALPRHSRLDRIVYDGRSRVTVYGSWGLRQEEWGSVQRHGEEGMNMSVARDEVEAVYVANLAKFFREVDAGCRPKHWLEHFMLTWPYHKLSFLIGTKVWRVTIKFERRHRTDSGRPYFISWHNRQFFLVLHEERRCLFVGVPPSWRGYEPCRALAVPTSLISAFKPNAMVDVDEAGTAGSGRDPYKQVALADHVVMVIMPILACAWPWSNEQLEDMADVILVCAKADGVSCFHCRRKVLRWSGVSGSAGS